MFKNTTGQKITVHAIDLTTGGPKTGDAANITLYVSKDDGAVTVLGDTSATQADATNAPGDYLFDLTQAETNADKLRFTGKSSTSGVVIVPQTIYTVPPSFPSLTIANNAVNANVTYFGGSAGTFASGRPDVNATHWAGTAVGSTEVRANLINIAGAAVSTSTAQLGVNVVNAGGTAWGSGAITAGALAADCITAAKIADNAIDSNTFAAGAINAAAIATDALTAAKFADGAWQELIELLFTYNATADYSTAAAGSLVKEIADNASGGGGGLDAAGVRAAVGLASANLDTQLAKLDTIDDFLDTEVAAIKAKTDNLPSDPADQSAVEAAITSATTGLATAANLATVAGYLDTEIAAILADTNELQTDWANGGRLDLLIDAIKAKTDTINDTYIGNIVAQLYADDEDRYGVVWTKNGVPITSGVSSPIIHVLKHSDNTVLINDEAMTEIGTSEAFKYTTTTNRVGNDEVALVTCSATIDGATQRAQRWIYKPIPD